MNNAGWRIQTSSAIRYEGTLFRKNFGNFWIPPTKRQYYSKIKGTDTDIEALYQVIAEQQGRGHTVCMTMSRP